MKVALVGYGKMGKTLEKILVDRGHEVVARFGSEGIQVAELKKADVAIEFSVPEAAYGNLKTCLESSVPIVTGTTGWLDRYDEIVSLCEQQKGGLIYASNFSLGVNLFFALNRYLAELMAPYSDYNAEMTEIHHIHKLDAPSGTAISLAEDLIKSLPQKDKWALQENTQSDSDLSIKAIRENEVPGTHSIRYSSAIDDIEITHTAHNRQGFALGAVIAAEYLNGKQGVYSMRDVLNLPS
tara:strand:- start:23 stop:739 length:717 start_codon:yes stop_codon:yes gene_type:complete